METKERSAAAREEMRLCDRFEEVAVLYSDAIETVQRAIDAQVSQDPLRLYQAVEEASCTLRELVACLDFLSDTPPTRDLFAPYRSQLEIACQVLVSCNTRALPQVRDTLEMLRMWWTADTQDRIEPLLSVYRSAIRFVRQAIRAVTAGQQAASAEAIRYAHKCLETLCDSLDFSQASPLPGHLYAQYRYHQMQLIEADRTQDAGLLGTVEKTLGILYSGWTSRAAA
jgi:flagellin-specific chaperone FliS